MSSAFQFINVPTGVWIDEKGKVVRPGEPAWTTSRTSTFGGKALVTEGEEYVAAIRDWVANGERSSYALSDEAFAAKVTRRSDNEMEADASFALAVHFYQASNMASAKKYFERAQALNPDDWNYHRQDWSFTPGEAGAKWMEKFQKLDEPYIRSSSSRNRRDKAGLKSRLYDYNDQPRRYSRFSRSFASFEFVIFMFAPS